jgi:hypothetical protein
MKLERTEALLHNGVDINSPLEGLTHILESALELLILPENDFSWSSWADAPAAETEIRSMLARVKSGNLQDLSEVSVLFAPTGSIQEVSLSSGWAEAFLKVAEQFDIVEERLKQCI